MSEAATRRTWDWDRYLEWEGRQTLRHELVDGQVHAMTGGSLGHDLIANNLRGELRLLLRGTPCRAQGPDLKVKAGANGRYPDALIDCGTMDPSAVVADTPVAVFEVLSKSTAWLDQSLKLRDYDATPSIRTYVLVNQDEPRVLVYGRDGNGRMSSTAMTLIEGLAGIIELPEPGISIPLSAIYEGIAFGPV